MQSEILWVAPAAAIILGYLLGSIPFGVLLTRMAGAGDLRTIGSGNIGATNVLRTGRKDIAAATLLLDLGKGAAAVLLAEWLFPGGAIPVGPLGGMAAFMGHCYPAWLKFRGGKGVATLMGIVLALHWPSGLAYAAIWLGVLGGLRVSSLAGMAAAVSAPVSAAYFGRIDIVLPLLAMALIVMWKHRENIDRLLSGTEPRLGNNKNEPRIGGSKKDG